MNHVATTVLVIEHHAADARRIKNALAGARDRPFRIRCVASLADGLERLRKGGIDVVLLDLMLPGCSELDAFDGIIELAADAPVVVLSASEDDQRARLVVQRGAHDWLAKTHLDDPYWLPLFLRSARECAAARRALRDNEARHQWANDASPIGVFCLDREGRRLYTNAAYHRISGINQEQSEKGRWDASIHPDDRSRVLAAWRISALSPEAFCAEFRLRREDGSVVWVRLNSAVLRDGSATLGRLQVIEDISERKSAESALQVAQATLFDERERARVALNAVGDAILCTDAAGNMTYANGVAERMTGWSLDEAVGRPLSEVFRLVRGPTRQIIGNPVQRATGKNQTGAVAMDCVLLRRDGFETAIEHSSTPIHNADKRVVGAVMVFRDVSESRSMAMKMTHLAQHDFLTGLPNRLLLTERLSQAIGLAQRHAKQVALLFLDIDHFKKINDSLGHAVGDQLLQSIATRLGECIRSADTVCRQGGDEFVILLAEIERPQDAAQVAETLLAAVARPHFIAGHELQVTLSIGISVFPNDGINANNALENADAVMQNADTAMYHAKKRGRNNYQFFRGEMNRRALRRLRVERNLRRALKQGEFVLYYQPQIDLVSGAMTGTEAFVRWLDPELGLVEPDQFVPIAEDCGLIVPIGRWVVREACRQARAWLDAGLKVVPVAVNVSAVEFRHSNFAEGLAQVLSETGLPAHYLELELTESIVMHEAKAASSVLEAITESGVKLAIDDFGMGYSSLSYLKRFPIDTLKIDQSFFRDVAANLEGASLVDAVMGMGTNLRQRVIAEGVEKQEQLDFLHTRQCAQGQGFLFSRPLAAESYARLLLTGVHQPPPDEEGFVSRRIG